ncbi:hypothetical protein PVAP13_7KG064329 [Panicum virgatum]|uniref:Uncharacterized protein n=1 Tax=Panicum virgatum TaxID=38727 RepID=A0A8T0QB69_PANVG|nr:hypothetical protein PVAP13_7KG064329 [Panicum virgatum]
MVPHQHYYMKVSAARLSPYNLTLLLLSHGQPKQTWLTWRMRPLDGATQNQRLLLVQRNRTRPSAARKNDLEIDKAFQV